MIQINKTYYILALIITIALFGAAIFLSNYVNRERTSELKASEEKIAIDILSLETEYDLLKESSCKNFNRDALRSELDSLSSRLQFMESQVGRDNPEVFRLKRYYSILQIKDYLLTKKMSTQCNLNLILMLYFYSHKDCNNCQKQEYILEAIQNTYPQVEVYSFDYELDLPAVKTLITLHNIPPKPPVIDINGKPYASFDSLDDMKTVIAPLLTKASSTSKTK